MSVQLASGSGIGLLLAVSLVIVSHLLLYLFVIRYGVDRRAETPAAGRNASESPASGANGSLKTDCERPVCCPQCGVRNDATFRYCWNCVGSVPSRHVSVEGTNAGHDE